MKISRGSKLALAAMAASAAYIGLRHATPAVATAVSNRVFAFCPSSEGSTANFHLTYSDRSSLATASLLAGSAGSTQGPADPTTSRTDLNAVVTIDCFPVQASPLSDRRVLLRLTPNQLKTVFGGQHLEPKVDTLTHLQTGVALRFDRQGKLTGYARRPDIDQSAEAILLALATRLQMPVDLTGQTSTWDAQEADLNAGYLASYTQSRSSGEIIVKKSKQTYGRSMRTAQYPLAILGSTNTAKVKGARLISLVGSERTQSTNHGKVIYESTSEWQVLVGSALVSSHPDNDALSAASANAKNTAWHRDTWNQLSSERTAQSMLTAALSGLTSAQVFAEVDALSRDADREAEVYGHLKALIAINPAAIEARLQDLVKSKIGDPLLRLSTMALGALGDAHSQNILRRIITGRLADNRPILTLIPFLGQSESATDSTLNLLAELRGSSDPLVRSTSQLALGTALRSEILSDEGQQAFKMLLDEAVSSASDKSTAVQYHLAIEALANAGREKSRRVLYDLASRAQSSVEERAEAAYALRFTQDSTAMLYHGLASSTEPLMMQAYINSLAHQQLSADNFADFAKLAGYATTPELAALASVKLLWQREQEDLRVVGWLRSIARESPLFNVRRAASQYLEVLSQ